MERRGSRRNQPLFDLKEMRRYWNLKDEAQVRTPWRPRCERNCGPVVRQAAECMNE
jgi:hypothetical protein